MVTKFVLVTMETRSDNPDFSFSTDKRRVAIRLHVKSEGMSNSLVTMTTDATVSQKMANFESLTVTMVTSKDGQP